MCILAGLPLFRPWNFLCGKILQVTNELVRATVKRDNLETPVKLSENEELQQQESLCKKGAQPTDCSYGRY